MSKIGIAEQQFGLAIINRVSDRARSLVWRTATDARQAACELDELRIHIGAMGGASSLELLVSDPDGWPILRLYAAAFDRSHRVFVADTLERLHKTAMDRLPSPALRLVEQVWSDAAEDAKLAHLVKRLSARPDAAIARRPWFAALAPRLLQA